MKALERFGYQCRLEKTTAPWSQEYTEVYDSGVKLEQPVSYQFTIGGDSWKLQAMPNKGWENNSLLMVVLGSGIVILLHLTGLTMAVIVLEEKRKHLRILAETDALTGTYNRSGFDHQLDQYLITHPKTSFVVAELDIDNFKSINDMYGHSAGDLALKSLASDMQKNFPKDAVVGRNGGDELILSRLVDTFFSRISLTMQLHPKPHSTAYVLPWEEVLHWQCRSSDCSSS